MIVTTAGEEGQADYGEGPIGCNLAAKPKGVEAGAVRHLAGDVLVLAAHLGRRPFTRVAHD